ncbi:unnamed protein product [Tilletia controversa]|nr:unnamed protein product [Tilletia controversa]
MSAAPSKDQTSPAAAVKPDPSIEPASVRTTVRIDGLFAIPAPAGVNTGGFDLQMSAEHWALIGNLQEVRIEDSYVPATVVLGWIPKEHWMALPKDWAYPTTPAADVGSSVTGTSFSLRDLAQVYALNKTRCPDSTYAAQFALLRMEAVAAGWIDVPNQTEVILVDPLDDATAIQTLVSDLSTMEKYKIQQAKNLGYVIPLISEYAFRTTGYYWRRDQAELQMHVLKAQLDYNRLPKPLKLRASHGPASTELIEACVRVINVLEDLKIDSDLAFGQGYDFELLKTVFEVITQDPFKYHHASRFYGVASPTPAEWSILDKARDMAIECAAMGQACITMGVGRGLLSDITALEEYAELNPAEQRRCVMILSECKDFGRF